MKYITFTGDQCKTYVHDYNTKNFTEQELIDIATEWQKEDGDGTEYYLAEIEDQEN